MVEGGQTRGESESESVLQAISKFRIGEMPPPSRGCVHSKATALGN